MGIQGNYLYRPAFGAMGLVEYDKFDAGLVSADEMVYTLFHTEQLPEDTAPTADDLIRTYDSTTGLPKKVTIGNLFSNAPDIILNTGSYLKIQPTANPGASSVANGAAGTIPAGTYNYKCTWTKTVGTHIEETGLGTVSANWVADGTHQCTITQPANPPSYVTGWKVYRSKDGPTTTWWELFVAPIVIATTTYSDNAADAALTVAAATEDNTYRSISSTMGRTVYVGTETGIIFGTNNTGFGESVLNSNTYGYGNVALGGLALYSNTVGYENFACGYGVLQDNTTGFLNVGIGAGSLRKNTTGNTNVAIGDNALYYNTEGISNTAIGVSTLTANTTADYNVAIGAGALVSNVTSDGSVGIGYQALTLNTAAKSTAVGMQALAANTSGIGSSAFGAASLYSSTGAGNTAIGYYAGSNGGAGIWRPVTTGSYLTFIGREAGLGSATQRTNSTAIGANATVDADNTIVLGDANVISILMNLAGTAIITAGSLKVGANQVVGARVVDARCDDIINSGDATTDGVIDSLRDAMIAHGLIAAA